MSLFLSTVIVIATWDHSHSERIICQNPGECANSQYSCNTGSDDCSIICSADNACGSSTFSCNHAQKCNITCNANIGSACTKTHFNAYDKSTLLFTGHNEQFLSGYLLCNPNTECNLQCGVINNVLGNAGMCKKAIIDASQANKLNIKAMGQETLRNSQIYCPETGTCVIDLVGSNTGNYKISNAAIFVNDPRTASLKIICEDTSNADACYGDDANAPILFCFHKTHSCVYITRNGRDWFCKDGGICAHNYTFVPTNIPSHIPSKEPTLPPNHASSNNGNSGVIAVIVFLILFCCVVSAFFAWKWYNKRKSGAYGSYDGLLDN